MIITFQNHCKSPPFPYNTDYTTKKENVQGGAIPLPPIEEGESLLHYVEYNVDSFFDDIFNRFIKKISEFVYDDELLFSVEGVEGYVWATDDLVYRLKEAVAFATEKTHFEDLEPMDNINFYPAYNVVNNTVSLKATYWYIDNGSVLQQIAW